MSTASNNMMPDKKGTISGNTSFVSTGGMGRKNKIGTNQWMARQQTVKKSTVSSNIFKTPTGPRKVFESIQLDDFKNFEEPQEENRMYGFRDQGSILVKGGTIAMGSNPLLNGFGIPDNVTGSIKI